MSYKRELLSGWGRVPVSAARVVKLTESLAQNSPLASHTDPQFGMRNIARGLGRSYGDAASAAGGTVWDATGLHAIHAIDIDGASVQVGAGVSLETLMAVLLPLGLFVPVTPGTRQVTVGGAIAADIHGKNHHVDGSFGMHVQSLSLSTSNGMVQLSPHQKPDLFWATVGGMGLTGVIVQATISLLRVQTSLIRVDTERASNLDDVLAKMASGDDAYRYSVAWIDCLSKGKHLGRSVLTRGDHASLDELSRSQRRRPFDFQPASRLSAPPFAPPGLLNKLTVAAFNEAWFRKAPIIERGKIVPLTSFFHPLDGVRDWNRLYGRRGFLQYQFVVPFGAEQSLRTAVERLARSGQASFLAVLKRFGSSSPAPLSFPSPGWTLALDIPVGSAELGPMLDDLDELVTSCNGRVYLAKDSRMRARHLGQQYPRLQTWRDNAQELDPEHRFCSDLCFRLNVKVHKTPAMSAKGAE